MKLLKQKSRMALILSLAIWPIVIGVGVRYVMNFENKPGAGGNAPSQWPNESKLRSNPELPTLVMMVHPLCPCSRASVNELAVLMTQERGRLNAEVVFVKPVGVSTNWEQTELWQRATSIPGVQVRFDDGTEARRFGSLTSGQVMLYSSRGEKLFSGGITSSRGLEGDNDGRRTLRSLLDKGASELSSTPVFGCPLFNDTSPNNIKNTRYVAQSK